ncbi:Crp/Fnr family transcriptional regulator [Pedobacter nototheniae]|uniref:Crp/Fnr family transcriptional regulator n=1 Tax=Pedobacter nototheniae TaxID=2488994 RepID=UPI00103DAA88|nr:Crp/Fnr family transcriptional regulator [Pedobacter nototheniae]
MEDFQPLYNYLQLFRSIPVEDWELIKANLDLRRVEEGEKLLQAGKIAKEMFFVRNGVLRIIKHTENGNDVTIFFLKENSFCTFLDSFTNNTPTTESLQAACDTDLIILTKDKLFRLYEKLPYLRQLIGNIVQQALLNKITTRNIFMGQDATARYRNFLLHHPEIALRVSLSDIASYLGVTQQSLSRIRKNFFV